MEDGGWRKGSRSFLIFLHQPLLPPSSFPPSSHFSILPFLLSPLPPSSVPPFFQNQNVNNTMIRNYLKIALRNLVKSKGYSAINICGLSVGMAVAVLIGLWVYDELSFDHY